MQQIDFDLGIEKALDSLLAQRLTLLAGAGLSMAAPSSLPSAYTIAAEAKRRYDAMHGASRPPLPTAIEEQAEFFFQRDELASVYFRTLIDQNIFAAPPNEGHYAVADLLLVPGHSDSRYYKRRHPGRNRRPNPVRANRDRTGSSAGSRAPARHFSIAQDPWMPPERS